MKINFKLLLITTLISVGAVSLFFTPNAKILAQTQQDEIVVNTSGYSVLSSSSFIFGGYYSGNFDKKGFTTYFEFKKDNPNLNIGAEETVKIVRETNIKESGDFYSSPELNLFSNYYFRAVGYFNDNPSQKFYGNVLNLRTGYIPPGTTAYPFTINENGSVVSYVPPICIAPQILVNGVCEDSTLTTTPPACIAPQILIDGVCEDPASTTTPILTYSNLTPTSVTLNSFFLASNGIYKFKLNAISGSLDAQVTASSTGTSSASFSDLTPNQNYTASISEYEPSTGFLTSSRAPIIYFRTPSTSTPASNNPTPSAGAGTSTNSGSDAGGGGLVKCGTERDKDNNITNPCGFNDVLTLINTVIKFILFNLALPIAAIMFAYAGFELVTSGGSTEKKSKAKEIFTNVAIGLIVIAVAFLIIQTILSIVGYDQSWNWFGF